MTRTSFNPIRLFPALAAMILLTGCGGSSELRSLSGEATYDGKPIPTGSILFEPDESKGNSGPGGAADIVNGKFQTRKNSGVGAGPQRVTVYGFDPALNKDNSMDADTSLFPPYETEIDLAPEARTLDIRVPVQASK